MNEIHVVEIRGEGRDVLVMLSNGESVNTDRHTAYDPSALAGMLARVYRWRLCGPIPTPTTQRHVQAGPIA